MKFVRKLAFIKECEQLRLEKCSQKHILSELRTARLEKCSQNCNLKEMRTDEPEELSAKAWLEENADHMRCCYLWDKSLQPTNFKIFDM